MSASRLWNNQRKAQQLAREIDQVQGELRQMENQMTQQWSRQETDLSPVEWTRQHHPQRWKRLQKLQKKLGQLAQRGTQLPCPDPELLQDAPPQQEQNIVQAWVRCQLNPRRVERLLETDYAWRAAHYVRNPDQQFLEASCKAGAAQPIAQNDDLTPQQGQKLARWAIGLIEKTQQTEKLEEGWKVLSILRGRKFQIDQDLWERAAQQWIKLPEIEQQGDYMELFPVPILGKLLEKFQDDPIITEHLFRGLLSRTYHPRHHSTWQKTASICDQPEVIPGLLGVDERLLQDSQVREEILATTRGSEAHEKVLAGFLRGRAGKLTDNQLRHLFRLLGAQNPKHALYLIEQEQLCFKLDTLQPSDLSVMLAHAQDESFRQQVLRKIGDLTSNMAAADPSAPKTDSGPDRRPTT